MSSFVPVGWYSINDVYYHHWVMTAPAGARARRIDASIRYRNHRFYVCVYGEGYFQEQSDSLSLQHAQAWCERVAEPMLTAVLLAN